MVFRAVLLVAILAAMQSPALLAQGLTGEISGRVQDPSEKPVAGVAVVLSNPSTGLKRETKTGPAGEFLFEEVLPGNFGLAVESQGFKKFEQTGIVVTASERRVLNTIVLTLGAMSETVTVTTSTAVIETESSDRSGLVDSSQIQELSLKGRDYLGTMKLLPGVFDLASPTREAPGNRAIIGLYVNGNRQGTLNLNLDGISTLTLGGGTGPFLEASTDAVAEVKVLQTNYEAEYGRSVGGTINTVTKSGTRDFHGGVYYFFRNEDLNANDFFANSQGLPRSPYRYNNPGYFIGGPVIFPGTGFNRTRDKLFFFWSHDILSRTVPSAVSYQTFPTALERQGNFSQSVDQNGLQIVVKDPNTGVQFPGNIVPASRISPQGQLLLNVMPLPNTVNAGHTYNSVFQTGIDEPHTDQILRVDWKISDNTIFYARGVKDTQANKGGFGFVLASPAWPQLPVDYEIPAQGIVGTLIHTFSPTRINELTFGVNRGAQTQVPLNQAGANANSRSALGLNIPQFYPQSNPYNFIPNATFGGVSDAPQLFIDPRFPYFGRNNVWDYTDNYSQIVGAHHLKAGIFFEHSAVNEANSTSFNGTFGFDRDPNNPLDSGYAFSNALLGVVDSYTESSGHPGGHVHDFRVEWYAQDNWKVNRRLTIDAGIRFYWLRPNVTAFGPVAVFDPATYNRSQQPPLIQPYLDPVTGVREGRDPVTGAIVPAVKIGSFSTAAGTPYEGMKIYPGGTSILKTPPIQFAPRFGFAYDVFGDGKTAIRSGFGIYYDRFPDDQVAQLATSPPIVVTPTANYTTISNLVSSPLSLSPNNVFGIDGNWKPLAVYNWSFGVQQNLGLSTVLDVAYVGNVERHGMQVRDLNATPYGTDFLPASIDHTLAGNKPLPANFLRPYPGYGDISYMEFASNSNYNSLQVGLRRRFSTRLSFSVAYTWSKVLDTVDTWTSPVNPVINYQERDYGPAAFDRHQNLSVSLIYTLPRLAKNWDNVFSRQALEGWEISSIASFIGGSPTTINYSFVTAVDITGANGVGVDSRVDLTCNANLGFGNTSISRAFNTSCIHAPTLSELGIGNAPKYPFIGPGTENFDISLFKTFAFSADSVRRLQFRLEAYNALNHAQFTGVDNNARFDASGNQVSTTLGQYNAAAPSRRVVLGLKLYF
jgi:hypothetical protein